MQFVGQVIVDSLLLGGIYMLAAVGLSLSFGVTRIINFAHGEAVMLGAYGAFWALSLLHLDPLLALPLLMLAGSVAGYLLFRWVISHLLDAPQENQILLTFGLALILQNLALYLWSGDQRATTPDYALNSLMLGSVAVNTGQLVAAGVALVLVGALFAWLRASEFGRATRALAEDRRAAVLMGINVPHLYALTFGISVALGAAAGGVLSFILPITPFMGSDILVKAFAIVVLGGFGNVVGATIGAFLLAFAETAVAYYVPEGNGWSEAVAFAVLFAVLVLRPGGILGQAVAD
jgi:branched-chain amino acid transport system permease protein